MGSPLQTTSSLEAFYEQRGGFAREPSPDEERVRISRRYLKRAERTRGWRQLRPRAPWQCRGPSLSRRRDANPLQGTCRRTLAPGSI